jgi:hypothetical protein
MVHMTETAKKKLRAKIQKTFKFTSVSARRIMAMLAIELGKYENYDIREVDVVYLDDGGQICNDLDNTDVVLSIIGYVNELEFRVLGHPYLWARPHPLTADIG